MSGLVVWFLLQNGGCSVNRFLNLIYKYSMKNKSCKSISMSKKGPCSTLWSCVYPRRGADIRPGPQVPEASSHHWARRSRHSCNLFGLQPPDPSSPGSGEIRCNSWCLAAKHRFDRAEPQREQPAGADSQSGGRMRCIIPGFFFSFLHFKTYWTHNF